MPVHSGLYFAWFFHVNFKRRQDAKTAVVFPVPLRDTYSNLRPCGLTTAQNLRPDKESSEATKRKTRKLETEPQVSTELRISTEIRLDHN